MINVKQKMAWLLSVVMLGMLFSPLAVFASEADVTTVEKVQTQAIENTMQGGEASGVDSNIAGDGTIKEENVTMSDIDGSTVVPDTSIEDANQWVSEKGNDLVGFGGTVAEPFAIIGFMLGLFLTLAGAITKSSLATKGLFVMALSIVVYVGAVFAPDLVHYFSNWLSS